MRKSMAVLLSACIIIGALGSSRAVHAQEASPLGLTAGVVRTTTEDGLLRAGNGVASFGIGNQNLDAWASTARDA